MAGFWGGGVAVRRGWREVRVPPPPPPPPMSMYSISIPDLNQSSYSLGETSDAACSKNWFICRDADGLSQLPVEPFLNKTCYANVHGSSFVGVVLFQLLVMIQGIRDTWLHCAGVHFLCHTTAALNEHIKYKLTYKENLSLCLDVYFLKISKNSI